jgi:hypothetical protein
MNLQTIQPAQRSLGAMDASRLLLRDLIDYAGLFPPAALGMAAAVANYDAYSQSESNWILGRFIVPVARLGEFEEVKRGLPKTGFANWRLSVLLGSDAVSDVARIRKFNSRGARSRRMAIVESVEVKVAGPEEIDRLSGIVSPELTMYFEVPLVNRGECIAAMASCGRRAKIRTGGETADKFPASEDVIEFIRLCAAANVPFKATAGLHHPLRSAHRFTHQSDSPSGTMHGFINVFLAAAFLRAGIKTALAAELLEEESSRAFQFNAERVSWREHHLSQQEIAAARQGLSVSFGSCSFTEPIDDLRSLHLL